MPVFRDSAQGRGIVRAIQPNDLLEPAGSGEGEHGGSPISSAAPVPLRRVSLGKVQPGYQTISIAIIHCSATRLQPPAYNVGEIQGEDGREDRDGEQPHCGKNELEEISKPAGAPEQIDEASADLNDEEQVRGPEDGGHASVTTPDVRGSHSGYALISTSAMTDPMMAPA